jgi:fatty-acyl-CoA synthase
LAGLERNAELFERLKGDLVTLKGAMRALKLTTPIANNPSRVFPTVISDLAQTFGDAPALLSAGEQLTYRSLAERANRYARFALGHGIAKGDTVGLLMPNCPEYMAIWLGITAAGGIVALLNTNLVGHSLAHSVNLVAPKHIIVANALLGAVLGIHSQLAMAPRIWLHGDSTADFPRVDLAVSSLPGERLAASERPQLTIEDRALYIYTSGTTGLPKAANINHYRLMLASHGFAGAMDVRPIDRMYDALPMYHTNGGVVATGAMLVNGGSVVIRDKFSAHEFWDDVVRWDCTLFFYIGEVCRYLVNSKTTDNETRHRIRLCCGNGLRPDVWPKFQQRFRIPQILEFYAATEGNVSTFNFESKPGAVGRIPWFFEGRFPTTIIKCDIETEQPLRDARGFCIRCTDNEVGEAIGQIIKDPSKPGSRFEGYADRAQTERKILHDVFAKGDAWFRTGDLLRKDEHGYFYFVDRIGDTFRWKGENVATSEVEEALTAFASITEATVYGVRVPGYDGRAGMAALVVTGQVDLARLRDHLSAQLPPYARPLFLRVRDHLDVTGTFKHRKLDLLREGFDPSAITETLLFNDPERQAFVPLDQWLYGRITTGALRL